MSNPIHYTKPSITDREIAFAKDAVENGWGKDCYKYIDRFESQFAEFTGAKYCIATSSCTGAIHMGLAALGIERGDEVIIADINWIASAAPISYLGASPVFVDVDKNNWCIDPEKVAAAITHKTKAIIAVHLYGNVCQMERLLEIGVKYGIPVIEDAAEAIGSYWGDSHVGTLGKFGTFSFHGTKTMTTGEGGAFITNDESLFNKVLTLSNHGRSAEQEKQFWPDMIGFKYKMSNIQAAIGCAQVERLEELTKRKSEIFALYKKLLSDLPLSVNIETKGSKSCFWMPTIVVDEDIKFERQELLNLFKANQIDARVFFWPLSSLPMYEEVLSNEVSYSLHMRGVNLPSFHDMSDQDIEKVCAIVHQFFKDKV